MSTKTQDMWDDLANWLRDRYQISSDPVPKVRIIDVLEEMERMEEEY